MLLISLVIFYHFQYNGTIFKCQKGIVDNIPIFDDPLKDHQKIDMVTGANGKIQETWFKQAGRIRYNDELLKTTWNMEQTKDEDGNQVLKVIGQTTNCEHKDGSSYQLAWTTHWFHFFKFSDEFFEIPEHCKRL